DAATRAVVEELKNQSTPLQGHNDIEHIATISANDPEIGRLLAEAMDKVGKDGVITVEEGKSLKVEVEYTEGMQFDRGYISPYYKRSAADGSIPGRAVHADHRQEDQRHDGLPASAGEPRPDRPQGPAHHCRGRRRRSSGDAGCQQATRHPERGGSQGARLRRSPQGHAASPGTADRRP